MTVCIGREARVPGMIEDPELVDVGLGLRPDLTGQGESRRLVPAILTALERRLGTVAFRAVVAVWNVRAQRAAERAGFTVTGVHQNERGQYVVLVRPATQPGCAT